MDTGKSINEHINTQFASQKDINAYQKLVELLQDCPIPPSELLANLSLFLSRSELSRILFMHDLYQKAINVPGVIMEFGCRWGRNLALWSTCHTMYEPYNNSRKIIGFDTFSGFPSTHAMDGSSSHVDKGVLSVTEEYETYLEVLLNQHVQLSPQAHIKRFELVKGDLLETLGDYLKQNPETIISLAYIDVDLYEPTKHCLELIGKHLTKGSIVAFDELNHPDYPGETIALQEVWGLGRYQLKRDPMSGLRSYLVIE